MAPPTEQSGPDPAISAPLGFLIASVGQQAMSAFSARLKPHGVHPRAFAVLSALVEAAGPSARGVVDRSQQDLSRDLGIPASRLVAIIDDLEGQGLVVREAHPTDRRVRTIRLTESGRLLAATLRREAAQLDQQLGAGLAEIDRTHLREHLLTVAANLGPSLGRDGVRIW